MRNLFWLFIFLSTPVSADGLGALLMEAVNAVVQDADVANHEEESIDYSGSVSPEEYLAKIPSSNDCSKYPDKFDRYLNSIDESPRGKCLKKRDAMCFELLKNIPDLARILHK